MGHQLQLIQKSESEQAKENTTTRSMVVGLIERALWQEQHEQTKAGKGERKGERKERKDKERKGEERKGEERKGRENQVWFQRGSTPLS